MRRHRFALPLALACTAGIGLGVIPANAEASTASQNAVASTIPASTAATGLSAYTSPAAKSIFRRSTLTDAATPNPGLAIALTVKQTSAFGYAAVVTVSGLTSGTANVTVDWGNGGGTSAATVSPSSGSVTLDYTYGTLGTYTITAKADDGDGDTATNSAANQATAGSLYTPYSPFRVLDTRHGIGAKGAPVPAGGTLKLQVTGTGIPTSGETVPAGISAIALNVTVTEATANGDLTVYGDESASGAQLPAPSTSNLNFSTDENIANLVIVPVGKNGVVDFHNGGTHGATQVIADVAGYYSAASMNSYFPITPTRILDTRKGTGTGKIAQIPANSSITLTLSLYGPVASYASAIAMNITAVDATHNGNITAYGGMVGLPVPNVSNLNYTTGAATANMAIINPISSTEVQGERIVIHNSGNGPVDVIADAVGYYVYSGQPGVLYSGGSAYVPLAAPVRLIDTRQKNGALPGPLSTGKPTPWPFGTANTQYTAGVFNATVVQPTGNGFLSLYPYNPQNPSAVPGTSNLNYRTGQTVPGLAIASPGTQSDAAGAYELGIYLGGQGSAQVVLDWFGYYQNH